jgi:Uma2 family endonuclease
LRCAPPHESGRSNGVNSISNATASATPGCLTALYSKTMQVVLPDRETRASFEVCGEDRPLNDEEFFDFCMKNSDLRIERLANGDIIIMPPAALETGYQNSEISAQLRNWAIADGRGVAFDSNTEFILASGAAFAPDASWILKSRLSKLTKEERKRFGRICPDFVIELRSPSDRLPSLRAKMEDWILNGAQLGWLIDPDKRIVFIYRPGKPIQELRKATVIEGEGPVDGFRLNLEAVWRGL